MTTETAVSGQGMHRPGLTDVRMMLVVHSSFRRELWLSPAAIRGVAHRDLRRAGIVAEHVSLFLGLLHHHHTIEDELLWPRLLERVPNELAPLVRVMESQHATVDDLITRTGEALQKWRGSAESADAAAFADVLDRLCAALFEHLHAEETHLLPLMAKHITRAEWATFTERGMSSIPDRMLTLGLGMMLYEGNPETMAIELRKMPAPQRLLAPALGRRAFRRYARTIHGTPSPARGIGTTAP